ncbi:dihydrofolate reductase family protein [Tropicimonas sp. TH_r6]|uniref:dihydrofolate reductase family protein n=1 Tax=Tropicimonas sp. TH_r6 TaxID=3082085 RepID=UPI002955C5A5|nr:dihydrofolate reductase family protein [Tropicimonas sp. TH_r6]MDV7141057.1 dihydrofolate reductase family protein [Tropicimonas sp. TH_r6]
MTTGHIFMAMSLDGFVARDDFGLDWLMKQKTDGEDHGYEAFMESVDGLVMGSGSFRTMLTFDAWPYEKPVVVLSKTLKPKDIPADLRDKVSISDQAPQRLMASLSEQGWERAYIDGGKIIQSFIREGLIADMIVTIVPILIGEGKRMFGPLNADIDLQLLDSKSFASGLVTSKYKVSRGS